MDPKDELLAKLKAIDAESAYPEVEPKLQPVSPPDPEQPTQTPPAISTDDFLAQLDALDQATRPTPPPQKVASTSNQAASPPSSAPPAPRSTQPSKPGSSSASNRPHVTERSNVPKRSHFTERPNVIERLKQFTQEQLAAHAAQNRAKAKRLQTVSRAQAWLDDLDPLSDDGFWFEQFAENYDSRIQAALDFLEPGRRTE